MIAKPLIVLTAAIFFLYGLVFLCCPHETLQFVVQASINSSSGVTDVRATYGGMSVGIGIVLYLLAREENTLTLGLLSVFILMITMAFGRVVGMVVDGAPNVFMYAYLALELTTSALALLLLQIRRDQ